MPTTTPGKPARPAAPTRTDAPAASVPRTTRTGRLAGVTRRVPRWWPLPVCAVVGALGGTAYATVTEPRYEASSYVLVSPGRHADAASALGYAQAYGKIATDAVVLAAAERGAEVPHGALRSHVRATTSPDAPMVQITGDSPKAGKAADYADAVARSLASTAKASASKTGVRLTVVSRATTTAEPVSPSMPVAVAVGASAGGLLGGLVLLARPPRRATDGPPVVPAPAQGGQAADRTDKDAAADRADGDAQAARETEAAR